MSVSPTITPSAWRWAITWSVVIIFLSCIPYAVAYWLAPAGWHFAGILVNPYDGQSYLAKMRQGFDGNWLFHLTYTPEPHEGAFIFTFYLALGHVARILRLPLIIVFHLVRLVAGLILLLTAYRFINLVTPHRQERRLAFVLLISAAGLGWLGAIFGAFPIDLWVPEAFVPYSLYANPHFPLGMALMLLILQFVVWPKYPYRRRKAVDGPQDRAVLPSAVSLLFSGLAALVLALILPFGLLTIWTVLIVYLGWFYVTRRRLPWPQIWLTLSVIIFSGPVILYDYWVSTAQPILAGWSAQNVTPAPPVWDLILGYGLVGLLAVVGGWLTVRRKDRDTGAWLMILWVVVTLALVYWPLFTLQRRLITGLHIPLCILAAMGLTRWLASRSLKMSHRRLLTNGVIVVGVLGTLFVWALPLFGLLQSPTESQTSALFFLRGQELTAFAWLRENITSDTVILASPRLGLFGPGQTGARVFYGHPFETVEADTKKAMVEAFYRGDIEMVSPVPDLMIYGPSEQALGQPQNLDLYPVMLSIADLTVYRVQ